MRLGRLRYGIGSLTQGIGSLTSQGRRRIWMVLHRLKLLLLWFLLASKPQVG